VLAGKELSKPKSHGVIEASGSIFTVD